MKLIDIEAINWYDDLFLKGVNHSGVWVRYRDIEKLIRNAPIVDAMPVVRCKDCKWRPRNMGMGVDVEKLSFPLDSRSEPICPYASGDPWYNVEPDPDGFCHRGERDGGDKEWFCAGGERKGGADDAVDK